MRVAPRVNCAVERGGQFSNHVRLVGWGQVRVALGDGEAGVAEPLLDGEEGDASEDAVAGEGVAEEVGVDVAVDAGAAGGLADDAVDLLFGEGGAVGAAEDEVVGARGARVVAEAVEGVGGEFDGAGLA